jgi:RHS repeat-associated protein
MGKSALHDSHGGIRSPKDILRKANLLETALIALGLATLTFAPARADGAPPVMSIAGEPSVSQGGAFTYRVPIAIPHGTAGMAPSLSLNYSSSDQDGNLGLGWTLNGIPSVTRCPKTLAQDNDHGGVNYNQQDRFCYEGKRLVATSGTYGADGTQYRLEVDDFTKFVSVGTSGTGTNAGPAYFVVRTKSGLIIDCGYDEDTDNPGNNSRFTLSATNATPRAWGCEKVSDQAGNYWIVKYVNDMTNGESYPTEIDYTGNDAAGQAPYASVQFSFTTPKTFVIPAYHGGYPQQTTKLLQYIKTFIGSTQVFNYTLTYTAASSGASHDELHTLTQCDPGTACLPAMTFGWQGTKDNPPISSPTTASLVWSPGVGDFNGDGILDLIPTLSTVAPGCSAYGVGYVGPYFGQPDGSFLPGGMTIGSSPACFNVSPSIGFPLVSDLNGDGFTDVAGITNGPNPASISINNRANGFTSIPGIFCCLVSGDFNGDGRTDGVGSGQIEYSNGDGTFTASGPFPWAPSSLPTAEGDFNGDGCADIGSATTYLLLTCDVFAQHFPAPTCGSGNPSFAVGDFNGDGLSDEICGGVLNLSTGTGFVVQGTIPPISSTAAAAVGDWNGDGKTDLYVGQTIYLSTGTGFTTLGATTGSATSDFAKIADWNNDGAEDIWLIDPGYTTPGTQYQFGYVPEFMNSVDNGVGHSLAIAYDRLNKNGSFYTRGSSAAYPTSDLDAPMYVVASLSESDGVGGMRQRSYAYAGAQQDLQGRGFLGFTQIAVTDTPTGVTQTTVYRLDSPYTPLIASQTTTAPRTGGGTVVTSALTNTYQKLSLGTGTDGVARWYVELCSTAHSSSDEDFSTGHVYAMPAVTTVFTYDFDTGGSCTGGTTAGYGNITGIVETTVGTSTSTKTTVNQYYPANTAKWFLGQLQESDVTRVVGASSITRHSSYSYSTSGLLSSEITEPALAVTNPLRIEADYLYDGFGNRNSVKVKACVWSTSSSCVLRTRTTTYGFDVPTYHGAFLTTQTNALTQSEHWAYDQRFRAVAGHTDLNGFVTSWTFNTLGQETEEDRPDSTKTIYSYYYCTSAPCTGLPTAITSVPGNTHYFSYELPERSTDNSQYASVMLRYYDGLNRVVGQDSEGFSSTSCDNLSTACWARRAIAYDSLGRMFETSRPYFLSGGTPKWTVYTYDILNRVVRTDFPDLSKATFTYQGSTASLTNDKSQTTTVLRNDQGLIKTVTDANNNATNYLYDAYNDPLSVTDPNSSVTSFTYDIRGRRLAGSDPDLGSWSYIYDGYSELYSQTDAKLQVTTLTYDALGRVLTRTEPDLTSTFTFDVGTNGLGRLTSETTGSGFERDYAYADAAGRPSATTTTIDGTAYIYSYTYQTDGQLATVTYPSGFVSYRSPTTNLGYLYEVRDGSLTGHFLWRGVSRDAEDHLLSQRAGNNVSTTQTFDPNTGLLLTTQAGVSNGVANNSYQFDTLENLTQRVWSKDNSGTALATENACYDSLNRLTQYNVTGLCTDTGRVNVRFAGTDGAIGNITTKSDICGGTQCFNYGFHAGPHALTSITGTYNGVTNPTFAYDANGNMTSGAGRTITPTSFNMAASITSSGFTGTLTYGSDHQRIKMLVAGIAPTTTYYLNDYFTGAIEEKVIAGPTATWNDYLQSEGTLFGERSCIGASSPCTGTPSFSYFTLDHLGSVSVIADSTGAVTQRLSYDPWGERRNIDGTAAACGSVSSLVSRGFTSQEMMDSPCLINFNARIYEPGLARFMSADSVVRSVYQGQSLNRYSYVENHPLSATDPSGNEITAIETVVVTADRIRDWTDALLLIGALDTNVVTPGGPPMGPIAGIPGPPAPPSVSPTPASTGNAKVISPNGKTATQANMDQASEDSDARSNSEPKEGDVKTNADGVPTAIYRNGQWVPVTEVVPVTAPARQQPIYVQVASAGMSNIPIPPAKIPGGPWTEAGPDGNLRGTFFGPKMPKVQRTRLQWVPPESEGGPKGSQGYWKTQAPGQKGFDRFNQAGEPITPEEAHPGGQPSSPSGGFLLEDLLDPLFIIIVPPSVFMPCTDASNCEASFVEPGPTFVLPPQAGQPPNGFFCTYEDGKKGNLGKAHLCL